MAMVLNEWFEHGAIARQGEESSQRGGVAARTDLPLPRLTEDECAGIAETEYLPAYMTRPYRHGRTPVHYWLASLAISVVMWWTIVGPLTNLL